MKDPYSIFMALSDDAQRLFLALYSGITSSGDHMWEQKSNPHQLHESTFLVI